MLLYKYVYGYALTTEGPLMVGARGFALPTVMIASVVMLIVLLSGLVAASGINSSLRDQYYQKLAAEATEAGVAMARMCLEQNNYAPQWTSLSLRTNTNCSGVIGAGLSCPFGDLSNRCGLVNTTTIRSSFEVEPPAVSGANQTMSVTGKVELRAVSSTSVRTITDKRIVSVASAIDYEGTRASKRFWYFGEGVGVDFGANGSPAPTASISPCRSLMTPCIAYEGTTVATDRNGTFLFWTDGRQIWNKTGGVMANSSGLNANLSTTQASLIFPLDTTQTKYVMVTNNAESGYGTGGGAGKLYFNVIDMTGDGGNGAVISKNVPVWSEPRANYSSESMAAAPKADGSGFWILAPDSVTSGIRVFSFNNSNPVSNPSPAVYQTPAGPVSKRDTPIGFGTLNFNDDYSRMVLMNGRRCSGASCSTSSGLIRIMGFNTTTGAVVNQHEFNNANDYLHTSSENEGYSADFSPEGKYIYTTRLYGGVLHRFKIEGTPTTSQIALSKEFIGYTNSNGIPNVTEGGGQVKRAPNGKMYVANRNAYSISVVNNPDAASVPGINWVYNGFSLGGTVRSMYGLPETSTLYNRRTTFY